MTECHINWVHHVWHDMNIYTGFYHREGRREGGREGMCEH